MNLIAKLMFRRHTHGRLHDDTEHQIVYREADVIGILNELGIEGPDWENPVPDLTTEEYRTVSENTAKFKQYIQKFKK